MKLRTHLLIASGTSIAFMLIFLIVSYVKMLLSLEEILWLTAATVIAGVISFITHLILTRPVEKAIYLISLESKKVAEGHFQGKVPRIGPVEFQELAASFNEMSEKLEDSFHKLQEAERLKRELVANISHDLRTPLSSIRSFVEALQDHIIEDEIVFQQYLKTIQLETDRLSDLIDDLFQLSHLESGVGNFTPEHCHLDNLIVEVLQNQYVQLEKYRMEVHVDLPEDLPPVFIMPDQIKRVMINLIQNAIQYSTAETFIRIEARSFNNGFVKVVITDQGEGIPEQELKRIFDRFYRVEKSRNKRHGGSGLGLAIARSIIEHHGGEIGAESTPGQGSSFWFTLPQCPQTEREA